MTIKAYELVWGGSISAWFFLTSHFLFEMATLLLTKGNCHLNRVKIWTSCVIYFAEKRISQTNAKLRGEEVVYWISIWLYKHGRCRKFWTPSWGLYIRNIEHTSRYDFRRSKIESERDRGSHRHLTWRSGFRFEWSVVYEVAFRNKRNRVTISQEWLALFNRNKDKFCVVS